MNRLWNFLGTAMAFRIVSVLMCTYFAVAALGRTGSYLDAFHSSMLFFAIWILGRGSVARGQQ